MKEETAAIKRLEAPMATSLIVVVLGFFVLVAYGGHVAESADATPVAAPVAGPAAIALPEEVAAGVRYLVPHLPASVVDQLPAAEAAGDR